MVASFNTFFFAALVLMNVRDAWKYGDELSYEMIYMTVHHFFQN
jgi:hypothetical protein